MLLDKALQCVSVAVQSETAYHALAGIAQQRVTAIFLAGIDVADVYFHHRCLYRGNGIVDGHRGVTISSGVEDDAVVGESYFMEFVDNLSFYVALVVVDFHFGELLSQPG